MASRRTGSILLSSCVLLTGLSFVLFATSAIQSGEPGGVLAQSTFSSSEGLMVGSDVEVAGVVVGKVTSIDLDSRSDLSIVGFTRPRSLTLPADSALLIRGGGPSSAASLSIQPGRSAQALAVGETITRTTPPAGLEDEIGAFIFGDGGLGGAD